MNDQNFGEHFNTPVYVGPAYPGTDLPVENPDPEAVNTPVLAGLVEQTPLGVGTIPEVNAMDATVVNEAKIVDTQPYTAPADAYVAYAAPANDPVFHEAASDAKTVLAPAALLDTFESEHLRKRWNEIQGTFVDEPRSAVQQADALVTEVVVKITQMFADEHDSLDSQWKQGNDVSTEDLRKALQHYRSFFNRLVV